MLKALRNLRLAKIGDRPVPFMSVMTNEADLIRRMGVTVIPISPAEVSRRAKEIMEKKNGGFFFPTTMI